MICLRLRAESFSQADFEGPLRHADQHDVHHDDAANYKRDQSDRRDYGGDAARKPIDLIVNLLNVNEAEIVVLVAFQLVMDAHLHLTLLESLLKQCPIMRLPMNLQALQAAEHSAIRRQWDVGMIVQRIAKHGTAFLLDSDDAHGPAGDLDRFAYRIGLREKLFAEFRAENDYVSRRLHVVRSNEPAVIDCFVFDFGHVGGDAIDVCPVQFFAVLFEINGSGCRGADLLAQGTVFEHPRVVVQAEPFVPAISLLPFLLAQRTDVGHARDHEMVDAEHTRHPVDHVSIQAADGGAHENHGRDADDHSDQGEKRA